MASQRHLILLRHAHAEPPASGQDDFSRTLSILGQKQATSAAKWIASHLQDTPRIIASPATRTRLTASALAGAFPHANIHYVESIYEASPGTLIRVLDEDNHALVVLIGHNPGLESLVALLTTGQSSASRGMSPGSVAWITTSAKELSPGCGELKLYWTP